MTEARFYEKKPDNSIKCLLCPVGCRIAEGKAGFCRVRENIGGTLYAAHYGKITSAALDPIEKKPLYHFHSGGGILSLGGYSCNFRCQFCQNHGISMENPGEDELTPEAAAELAVKLIQKGNIGIAYTYNEPFINYEYMYDTAKLIREEGLKNVVITNGYVNLAPLKEIMPLIDAMNIDLKAYNEPFYKMVGGNLESVKSVIKAAARECHVEVTTLVIPGENDEPAEIDEMARWLASLSPEIPLHFSRFFPNYNMRDKKPTPVEKLQELAGIAQQHLKYVYMGNV